jgi:hypothetical protein
LPRSFSKWNGANPENRSANKMKQIEILKRTMHYLAFLKSDSCVAAKNGKKYLLSKGLIKIMNS